MAPFTWQWAARYFSLEQRARQTSGQKSWTSTERTEELNKHWADRGVEQALSGQKSFCVQTQSTSMVRWIAHWASQYANSDSDCSVNFRVLQWWDELLTNHQSTSMVRLITHCKHQSTSAVTYRLSKDSCPGTYVWTTTGWLLGNCCVNYSLSTISELLSEQQLVGY